jgi:hypothetical protein
MLSVLMQTASTARDSLELLPCMKSASSHLQAEMIGKKKEDYHLNLPGKKTTSRLAVPPNRRECYLLLVVPTATAFSGWCITATFEASSAPMVAMQKHVIF